MDSPLLAALDGLAKSFDDAADRLLQTPDDSFVLVMDHSERMTLDAREGFRQKLADLHRLHIFPDDSGEGAWYAPCQPKHELTAESRLCCIQSGIYETRDWCPPQGTEGITPEVHPSARVRRVLATQVTPAIAVLNGLAERGGKVLMNLPKELQGLFPVFSDQHEQIPASSLWLNCLFDLAITPPENAVFLRSERYLLAGDISIVFSPESIQKARKLPHLKGDIEAAIKKKVPQFWFAFLEHPLSASAELCRWLRSKIRKGSDSADGPCGTDGFRWNGVESHGLTPRPFQFVEKLWFAKDKTALFDELANPEAGYHPEDISESTAGSWRREANAFFKAHGIPWKTSISRGRATMKQLS